jgi:hypothetical protein
MARQRAVDLAFDFEGDLAAMAASFVFHDITSGERANYAIPCLCPGFVLAVERGEDIDDPSVEPFELTGSRAQ